MDLRCPGFAYCPTAYRKKHDEVDNRVHSSPLIKDRISQLEKQEEKKRKEQIKKEKASHHPKAPSFIGFRNLEQLIPKGADRAKFLADVMKRGFQMTYEAEGSKPAVEEVSFFFNY